MSDIWFSNCITICVLILLPLLYYRWIFGLFSLYESSHHTDNQKVNIQNWTCKQCVESNWFETNVCTLYIRHLSRLEFAWEWKWQCRHSFAKTCLRFTFQKRKLFHAIWKKKLPRYSKSWNQPKHAQLCEEEKEEEEINILISYQIWHVCIENTFKGSRPMWSSVILNQALSWLFPHTPVPL